MALNGYRLSVRFFSEKPFSYQLQEALVKRKSRNRQPTTENHDSDTVKKENDYER